MEILLPKLQRDKAKKIFVGVCLYRPPNIKEEETNLFLQLVMVGRHGNVLIMGIKLS